ncbi:MAG: SDR family NAD(P)-dependent oxidoreductase [Magnetococcus sp. DMHC-6]
MLLKDHIILITGAGRGIGAAIALTFAREGAMTLLLGRDNRQLEKTYDMILAENGRASIVPLDLEKELHRVPELVKNIYERFGKLDVLVNNAGYLGTLTPLDAYAPEEWEKVMRINVTAPFYLTRELMPLLRKSAAGSVINLSSSVGEHGRAFWGAYAASKAALINLTETWAMELQRFSLRFNTVNPGATATHMRALAFPGENPNTLSQPNEITPVFLYLASHLSLGVTGSHFQAQEWIGWRPGQPIPL